MAEDFVNEEFSLAVSSTNENLWRRLWKNTKAHLFLVLISLSVAILLAIPLGIVAAKNENLGKIILGIAGVIQTIPSLALLVFMIPLLGIGAPPAIVALFFYSLLPIVRNTYTGLHDIPAPIRESALALGLPAKARLLKIELPLASRSILAGIKRCLDGMSDKKEMIGLILLFFAETFGITYSDFNPVPNSGARLYCRLGFSNFQ